jgi:glycosyltransferase involved in cell wall biosynthesis
MKSYENPKISQEILCLSSSDWDGKWGSRQQVMGRLARRGYRVLFVERQVGLEHLIRHPQMRIQKSRRWKAGLTQIQERVWLISLPPLLPGRYYSKRVASVNNILIASWLKPYLRELGIRNPILWMYRPEHGGLIGKFGESLTIYHCIDEFTSGQSGRKRRIISQLETGTLTKSDLVFANSTLTFNRKKIYNKNTFQVPSGVDVEIFRKILKNNFQIHSSLATIAGPIAGYVGTINQKLDITLLYETAKYLPDWQLVLVGKTDRFTKGLSKLEKLPNIYLLGDFPPSEIPAIIKGFAVCLLPYRDDEYTKYRSPLKLYEYLAAGKPIVATEHPEAREFEKFVTITSGVQHFIQSIRAANQNHTSEQSHQKIKFAQKHSWERRVDLMERIINDYKKV